MIFNYNNLKTNLEEILYLSGVGHSLAYPAAPKKFIPLNGYLVSQSSFDKKFLADINGLSYYFWQPEIDLLSDDECWEQYWSIVKENISKDIPILATVNAIYLPYMERNTIFPKFFFNYSNIASIHNVVINGFDEENKKVCYYDPAAELYDSENKGINVWMELNKFRKAIATVKFGKNKTAYLIEVFKKNKKPLTKKEQYSQAHSRNIERMKGSNLAYAKRYKNLSLGIRGLKRIEQDFERENEKQQSIISMYKRRGFMVKMIFKLRNMLHNPSADNMINFSNTFEITAIEKKDISNHLEENINFSDIYQREKRLFRFESEKFRELSLLYSKFIEKNIFLKKTEALNLIREMIRVIGEIISIENDIINDKEKD
jgi:hypothetical protein